MRSAIAPLSLLVLASGPDLVRGGGTTDEIDLTLDALHTAQQTYYDLLAAFDDDDEDAPPGPPGGWPHRPAFSTTPAQQVDYNARLEEEFYVAAQEDYFQAYGGKDAHGIHVNQIARPEGATTGYYTGVTHFRHVNDPDLVTFLFSNGRHDGGTNTFLTIDTSVEANPFEAAQENFINETDVSTYTWVSAYTKADRDGPPVHYALFSGGSGSGVIGPSKLYIYDENPDGTLMLPPRLEWVEPVNPPYSARYCLLTDLGDLYDDEGTQVSVRGLPDILITGTGGLDVYSTLGGGQWARTRNISIADLDDDTVAFLGIEVIGNYLVIAARTSWSQSTAGPFDAPCLVYDYVTQEIVQRFASAGQTVSVAVLDDMSHVLIGAGGQTSFVGQPNLMFDAVYDTEEPEARYLKRGEHKRKKMNKQMKRMKKQMNKGSKSGKGHKPPSDGTLELELSATQLARGMPRNYTSTVRVDPVPVSSREYFVVPAPGTTRSRQVAAFRIDGDDADLVLEVNSAQACNIYYRPGEDLPSSKVMPLPGSEGIYTQNTNVYARGGDTLLVGDQLYVVLAMYNGNNTVYSFSTEFF